MFADGTIELQPGNNPATGTVNITGTAAEDQLLTAVRAFNDGDGVKPNTTVFDWQIEEQPDQWVTIARGSELRLGDGEVGSRIRVEATYEDNKGVQEIVRSAAVGPVTNVNDDRHRTAAPRATRRRRRAVTLTSLTGPIDDNDGLVGVTFNHQWQQEIGGTFTDIDGATNARFTPGQDQVGRRLRVVVRVHRQQRDARVGHVRPVGRR